MTVREFQEKQGKEWTTTNATTGKQALHSLATDLAARYIGKAAYIKRIERRNNYDGTQTYTVYYNLVPGGHMRAVYVTDIY